MNFRSYASALLLVAGGLTIGGFGLARAATSPQWQRVTFDGVSVRVPARWPVVRFSQHPTACPRLDVHAVYLGTPGPDPVCPPNLLGKTEAVLISPLRHATGAPGRAGMIRNADWLLVRTITDQIPRAGVQVMISYRANRRLALRIQASIRVGGSARPVAVVRQARPAAAVPASGQGVFTGSGFDTCAAPSASAMTAWLASKFRAVGIYIGGINRACAQANLSPGWLRTIQSQGWHYFPIYPGLQSSCVLAYGDATITTSRAAAEGRAAADDAAAQAAALGIPTGTPLIYDMEAYGPTCNSQVITFLSAWDAELHARGYSSGVYESFTNVGALISAAGSMTEPDVIYYADWDGIATTASSYMPATMWTNHQRLHQYLGGHLETHGGVTLDIDSDQLDVNLGGQPVPTPSGSFRAAVAINANGTAEWFARSSSATLVHSWQQPVGSLTWSATHTVGDAPGGIVTNPTVTRQPGGALAVFARNGAGQIVHAWQQAGFPNDWEWGTPLGLAARSAKSGTDPASVLLPDGRIEVLQTATTGAILTAAQRQPNNGQSWTRWGNIKGSCASTPAAAVDAARTLDVLCVTRSGQLAIDTWNGGLGHRWSGWSVLPGGPSGLTGTPAVTVSGAGQTEVFAVTAAGGIDWAWQSPGAGWTWGTPIAAPGSGVTVTGSPSASSWQGGLVAVYAALSDGQVGYVLAQAATGQPAFGGWSVAGGTVPGGTIAGSPTGWLNASGAAGVAVLDGNDRLAVSYSTPTGWSAWAEMASGF